MPETTTEAPTPKRIPNPFRKFDASACYRYIVEQFMKKQPIDERVFPRISNPSGNGGYAAYSNSAWGGGPRMFVSDNGKVLYSYRQSFPIAEWVSGGMYLIANADWSPSQDTTHHQRLVRDIAKEQGITPALIPYEVLRAPGIRPASIQIVATTPDNDVPWTRRDKCRGEGCSNCRHFGKPNKQGVHLRKGTRHYLGEVLFIVEEHIPGSGNLWQKRYFVCGLDRNDDPRLQKFFLARLPLKTRPKTVDEALAALMPDFMPEDAKRQGEWFFQPVEAKLQRQLNKMSSRYKVPVVSADPAVQRAQLTTAEIVKKIPLSYGEKTQDGRSFGRRVKTDGLAWKRNDEREARTKGFRMGRHCAEREIITDEGVFVRGKVQDREHDVLDLGKTWHWVVRNLADGSWSMPEREGRPARVD